MTDQTASTDETATDAQPPVFPARAPDALTDPATAVALLAPVLEALAGAADMPAGVLDRPTPCRTFTVGELRRHVLAWLQFFAAALDDPDGNRERIDPESWSLGAGDDPATIVGAATETMVEAIRSGVGDRLVLMSQARMRGDAVVAMALGEYIVHGWDLSVATGRPWSVADEAAKQARLFLEGTVAPEYRGEDSGFFGEEIPVSEDAPMLERLLGFAGRNPRWRP